MKSRLSIICLFSVFMISGCATKQYPQAAALTPEESSAFDCIATKQEIAKAQSVKREIDTTGQFDGRTVIGVLGDFGIGNGMAKEDAYKKVNARLQQLEILKIEKCKN